MSILSDVSPKVDASQPKKDPESAAANDSPSNPKDSSVNKKSGRDFQTSSFDDFLGGLKLWTFFSKLYRMHHTIQQNFDSYLKINGNIFTSSVVKDQN